MTDDREPAPELTTTHLGGGRNAWLVALVAIVVLGAFAYVGVTGPATTQSTPQPKPSAAVALASPTAPPTPNLNEVISIRTNPTAPLLYQFLGTGLALNGHGTLAVLDSVGPDQYRGIYRIPYALVAPTARLEFDSVTASVSHDDLDQIGAWTVPLNSVVPGDSAPVIVLDTSEGRLSKTLSNPDFARLATNGYRLTVTLQGQPDALQMTIDIAVTPDQFVPDESPTR
jgi:hypothetical protein